MFSIIRKIFFWGGVPGSSIQKYRKGLSILLFLLLCCVMYRYYLNFTFLILPNSDTVTPILQTQDILNGNFFLHDWYGSTRAFLVESYIFYLLPVAIWGVSVDIFYYVPAFTYLLFVIISLKLAYKSDDNNIRPFNIFFVLTLLAFPFNGLFSHIVLQIFNHMETYLCIVVALCIIDNLESEIKNKFQNIFRHLGLFFISFIILTNPFSVYLFLLPMIMIFIYCIIFNTIVIKKYLYMWGSLFLGSLIGILSDFIIAKIGGITYETYASPIFIELHDFGNMLQASVKGILIIFNADFFGKTLSQAFIPLIEFVILLVLLSCLAYSIKKFRDLKIVDMFLIFSPTLLLAALIFSTMIDYNNVLQHLRYFVFICICLVLLFTRSNMLLQYNWLKIPSMLLLCIHVVLNFYPYTVKPEKTISAEANAILNNGLQNGFADHWVANINTFYLSPMNTGSFNRQVAPINGVNNMNQWLNSVQWYNKPANFIITNNEKKGEYVSYYGKSQEVNIGNGNIILIWDYDISQALRGPHIYSLGAFKCDSCSRDARAVTLEEQGNMYGSNFTISKGIYEIKISGQGEFCNMGYDVFSHTLDGPKFLTALNPICNNLGLTYKVVFPEDRKNTEFRFFNQSDGQIIIRDFSIKKVVVNE